ncbi:regucalcin-like isoform X2 [Anoplolepis gracilipes]|uniref:regucalcin-like isoform X2 n=1 Tax=Anoplolepis gracilipes TaxID=354296 RepID=UPI003BA3D770
MRKAMCKYVSLTCVLIVLVYSGQAHRVTVEKVTDSYGLSEGPQWDHRTQKLFFVDIYNQYIRRLDPATGVVTSAYVDHGPVSVVVTVSGTTDKLVAGSGKDLILVSWDGEQNEKNVTFKVLTSIEPSSSDTRTNDGKVDLSGRFWLGTMANELNGRTGDWGNAPKLGSLYRINETLQSEKEITPVTISNGLAWNIKDDTFYYIDSPTYQVAAYDYNSNEGTMSNKRIVFDLRKTNMTGIPDGMTIDKSGNLWIAVNGESHVILVNPKTQDLLKMVEIPAVSVTSVAFGGPLLDILYVTTSGYNLTAEERKKTPDAGSVFAVKNLGICGVPGNSFKCNSCD